MDDIIERMATAGGGGETSEAAEGPYAWVGIVRKGLLIKLKQDFINAESAWDAYKPMEEHNTALVTLVADHLRITREEANAKLMTRIPSSRRRNSRAAATVVAYR